MICIYYLGLKFWGLISKGSYYAERGLNLVACLLSSFYYLPLGEMIMRRLASEVLRELETRVARLERTSATFNTDEEAIHELSLYIVNESSLYPITQSIISNQAKHMLKGRWNVQGAIKGFEHLVREGVKAYRKEFGKYSLPPRISRNVKQAVAEYLFEYYEDHINEEVESRV